MARVLYDGLVEYEDGTPATTSQMAKDVVEFLNWAAEPEMDDRKKMGLKVVIISATLFALSVWVKRYVDLDLSQSSVVLTSFVSQVQVVASEDTENYVQSANWFVKWQALRAVLVRGLFRAIHIFCTVGL